MSEMIERIVRAIVISNGSQTGTEDEWNAALRDFHARCADDPTHIYSRSLLTDAFRAARGAAYAMREPTRDMLAAASQTDGMKKVNDMIVFGATRYGNDPLAETTARFGSPLEQAWHAAIDVVLAIP